MRIFISTIFIIFLLLVPETFAESKNRMVAFVNDDVITLFALNTRIEEVTGKTGEELQAANEEEFFEIRKKVLDSMVLEKLMRDKIKELELTPPREQIESIIENIKERNKMTQEDLVAELEKEGLTFEKFREKLIDDQGRRNLIETQIVEKIVIGEDKIREYYEAHKKEYEKPGKAHIASIFLVPGAAGMEVEAEDLQKKGEDIIARLQKGEAFADLAGKFSNGPGAKEGGDLGEIALADVDPKILEVINTLKEGEVSQLINMGNRFQIIKLVKKIETEWIPIEEVKDNIYELLSNQEIEKRYEEYMTELKNNSYIKIIL
ncbi:MAG: peptidylprolyl isomerase [Deltaproteobacteria bacterium]|nr:peptidylprolyl isomerase [Deltaproteobacteria bacterium]